MAVVRYVFGRRSPQEYPTSGPCSPFEFCIKVGGEVPSSWYSAYALLGFFRKRFVRKCLKEKTCSAFRRIKDCDSWIPGCYIETPTIEVLEDGCFFRELLIDQRQPNPWLSME